MGPYFSYGLAANQYDYPFSQFADGNLLQPGADIDGDRIRVTGHLLDGQGEPVTDALLEIWQADAQGRYAHPQDPRSSNAVFKGFGRMGTGTDAENRFDFRTVRPGSVDGAQAPHINVIVFARGLLSHLYTRIYFADQAEANAADPILQSVPEERRSTLIATGDNQSGMTVYQHNICLQGPSETVFFDL
ncbi:MAG: protocatechuate 3,4-dioxygenase subunit alpha [Hyphomicrobiales bacterium]|nr:protocatechuate 3,4-dioxygenase subunit alpha [Hyphomicrobiales bacterium]